MDRSKEVTQRKDDNTKRRVEHFVQDYTSYLSILYDAVLHLFTFISNEVLK